MRVVIDRIEGELAILEVGDRSVDWPLSALPPGTSEGDVFEVQFTAQPPSNDDATTGKDHGLTGPQGDVIEL